MTKATELANRNAKHVMIFGISKSGKSTLTAKLAAAGYKLIWLSLDNGHGVIFKLPKEAQSNIDIISLYDTRDFPVAIDTLRKLLKGDACDICAKHGVVGCSTCKKAGADFTRYDLSKLGLDTIVVIDHVTQLTDSCIAALTKGKPVDYKLQLDDWGSLRFNMMAIMGYIQNANYNIICIAQEDEGEFADGSKKMVPQVGSRSFANSVGSFFDTIVHCSVMNKKHRYGSSSTYSTSVLTGSREDVEIEKMAEPSLLPIFSGQERTTGIDPIFMPAGKLPTSNEPPAPVVEHKIEIPAKPVVAEAPGAQPLALAKASLEVTAAVLEAATPPVADQQPITTLSAEEISARAKARLAAMRGGKK